MEFTAYIQSENGFPISDWAVSAYMGFRQKGTKTILFEEIEEVPASRQNIVVAFIEDTVKYFKRLGIPEPKPINIPPCLMGYTKRKIRYMTMGEFKADTQLPVFVKPNGRVKEFASGVITKQENKRFLLGDVPDETEVLVSDVIDIVSEYRCYVINNDLKSINYYLGDFRVFPDVTIIDEAIAVYAPESPSAYSIDFGVTSEGDTVLIECQDAWSIGNYGMEDRLYSTFLSRRWLEIMSVKNS